MIKTVLVKK